MAGNVKLDDLRAAAKATTDEAVKATADEAAKVAAAKVAADASDAAKAAAKAAVNQAATDPTNKNAQDAANAATVEAEKKDKASTAASEAADAATKKEDAAVKAKAAKEAADAAVAANDATARPLVTTPVPTSYFDLMKAVVNDPILTGEEKKLLLLQLKGICPTSDRFTYRTAIWILGAIALFTIGAIWQLGSGDGGAEKIPQGLIAIASGVVGGLAGLLSSSKNSDTHTP